MIGLCHTSTDLLPVMRLIVRLIAHSVLGANKIEDLIVNPGCSGCTRNRLVSGLHHLLHGVVQLLHFFFLSFLKIHITDLARV